MERLTFTFSPHFLKEKIFFFLRLPRGYLTEFYGICQISNCGWEPYLGRLSRDTNFSVLNVQFKSEGKLVEVKRYLSLLEIEI